MEREQLKPKADKVIPILDDPPADKPKAEALPPGAAAISVDNINGQMQELKDQNDLLQQRALLMRGQMADMQRQLKDQTQVIVKQAARIAELEGKSALRHRGNGRQR